MNEGTAEMSSIEGIADQTESQRAKDISGHCPGQPLSLYEPLSQDRDCTRLLRIGEATNESDPITCTLFEVGFGDKPKFDALSYMWGSGKAEKKIILNGHDFNVRQNLWDALHCLRKHCPDTVYWIDAICINQNAIDERNRQVRIMHHIYFRAQTVVIWLGKTYSKYEATLPDLRHLSHQNTRNGAETQESTPKPTKADDAVRGLATELYNNAYWKRLWIIQEIGLARKIKVCFGNSAVEWSQFIQFLTMHNLGSDGPIRLNKQREDKYSRSSTLLRLLRDHREAECQDRKDKVYGLLGMASDARGFVIDYKKSLFEIWTDVMEFMNRYHLFSNQDIISVGSLVKSLLMGPDCDPLQQILQTYEPGPEDITIVTDTNHYKAFRLSGAIVGCVIDVGPQPHEIIGKLKLVDEWIQKIQANYRDNLGCAHRESDELISTILDLDYDSLLKKCFDCMSIIRWEYDKRKSGIDLAGGWHDRTEGLSQKYRSHTERVSTDSPNLIQMSVESGTPWRLGLSSGDVRVGDIVCWLCFPRRAVVIRPYSGRKCWTLQVVGTAVVAVDLKEMSLGHSQRPDWKQGRSGLNVFLDSRTIFILLAD